MIRTRPFAELAADTNADPTRRARIEEYKRAIDAALALAHLRAQAGPERGGSNALEPAADGPATDGPGEDLYLATLQRYVGDLGGRLVFEAVFPDLRVDLLDGATSAPRSVESTLPTLHPLGNADHGPQR